MLKVLEIGHGGLAVGTDPAYFEKRKPKGVLYYGIDLPAELAHSIEELVYFAQTQDADTPSHRIMQFHRHLHHKKPRSLYLLSMDGRTLGFKDSVFDEVHMHYLVTQPDVSTSDVSYIVSEAHRVLKPLGYLIVTGEETENITKQYREGYTVVKEAMKKKLIISENPQDLPKASLFHQIIEELLCLQSNGGVQNFVLMGRKK